MNVLNDPMVYHYSLPKYLVGLPMLLCQKMKSLSEETQIAQKASHIMPYQEPNTMLGRLEKKHKRELLR
jgi:hypothetical protein